MSDAQSNDGRDGHIEWFVRRYKTLEGDDITDTTLEKRRGELERFREWYGGDLAEVEWTDIEDFVMDKAQNHGPNTIDGYRWALSKFYRHMEKRGRIDQNPVEEVPWKDISAAGSKTRKEIESEDGERIHPLTAEEVQALAENVSNPKVRNELVIRLMAQTGMRAGEVAHLKIEDVYPERREIDIKVTKSEPRRVAYQPNLTGLIDLWLNGGHRDVYSTAEDSPYLFVTRKKERMNNNLINKVVKKAADNAGIQKPLYEDAKGYTRWRVTSHALRHTFAVKALSPDVGEGSMNLPYLRDVMGHTDIQTTQKYLRYLEDDALESMKNNAPSF